MLTAVLYGQTDIRSDCWLFGNRHGGLWLTDTDTK